MSRSKYYQGCSSIINLSLIILLIFLYEKKYTKQKCKDVKIIIHQNSRYQLINADSLRYLIPEGMIKTMNSSLIQEVNLKLLYEKLLSHPCIAEIKIYKTIQNFIEVHILPKIPLARIITPEETHYYLDQEGKIFRLCDGYTRINILLLYVSSISYLKQLDVYYVIQLKKLLKFIHSNGGGLAEISSLNLDDQGEIILYPLCGYYEIFFGLPEEIKKKFHKLSLFYKRVITNKGIKRYKKINLKFKNQLICES